jgi:hypothetical protein
VRIVFFALWVPAAVLAALIVARLAWRETRAPLAAILAGLIAAAGLVVLPRTVVDTASAARHDRDFVITQSHRKGGPVTCLNQGLCVRTAVWAELRRLIPRGDTYYLDAHRAAIKFWTVASLLPRTPVGDPGAADWVIAYRKDPHALGVRYSQVRTIRGILPKGGQELVVAKVAP